MSYHHRNVQQSLNQTYRTDKKHKHSLLYWCNKAELMIRNWGYADLSFSNNLLSVIWQLKMQIHFMAPRCQKPLWLVNCYIEERPLLASKCYVSQNLTATKSEKNAAEANNTQLACIPLYGLCASFEMNAFFGFCFHCNCCSKMFKTFKAGLYHNK